MEYNKKLMRHRWLALVSKQQLYCILCGELISRNADLSIEHKQPISRGGGKYDPENCAPAHKICNHVKGNLTMDEWRQDKIVRIVRALGTWKLKQNDYNILVQALKGNQHV